MATQKNSSIAAPGAPIPRTRVSVEKTTTHDIYTGTVPALLAACVIAQHHLEPQPGRKKGFTGFMPDGTPVPTGIPMPASFPGTIAVQVTRTGECEVRKAVSLEERQAREHAEPTLRHGTKHRQYYYGSKDRLIRDGIPECWLENLPAPGKLRGRRTFQDGERQITVSVGGSQTSVDVIHIEYYRDVCSEQGFREKRIEWGLEAPQVRPIVRGGLSLAWSSANRGSYGAHP